MYRDETEEAVALLRGQSELLHGRPGFSWFVDKLESIATLITRLQLENERLRAALHHTGDELIAGRVRVALDSHEVFYDGERLELTRIEYEIVELLARVPDVPVSTAGIIARVWGEDHVDRIPTLRVHMSHLREKIPDGENGHKTIVTIPGEGYCLSTRA